MTKNDVNPLVGSTQPERVSVLHEAARLITGDRNISYGEPLDNFSNIAEAWTLRLRHKLKEDLTPAEVADLMILLKVVRNIADTKRDTYVDIAGYAGCGAEIIKNDE